MQPVADEYDMSCQIKIVQVAVGVLGRSLANHNAPVQPVQLLQTCVNTVQ
jgi:hypothetical protein